MNLSPSFLAAVACLIAGAVRGLAGFGGPLILVPVLTFFFNPLSAITTAMLVDLSANIILLPSALKQVSWNTVLPIWAGAGLTMPIGGYFLLSFHPRFLPIVIYTVVALVSLLLLTGWQYTGGKNTWHFFRVGIINGMIMGATSFGAAMYPFLMTHGEPLPRGRANFIFWALFCSLGMSTILLVEGRIGGTKLYGVLLFVPIYMLGSYIGNLFFKFISHNVFRKLVLFILIIVSIIGLLQHWGK